MYESVYVFTQLMYVYLSFDVSDMESKIKCAKREDSLRT